MIGANNSDEGACVMPVSPFRRLSPYSPERGPPRQLGNGGRLMEERKSAKGKVLRHKLQANEFEISNLEALILGVSCFLGNQGGGARPNQ